MPPGLEAALLGRLAGGLDLVALVSGRALPSLVGLFPGLEAARQRGASVYLVGNHGAEWLGPESGLRVHPAAIAARPLLAGVRDRLAGMLDHWPGTRLEDKGLTLTVHYRGAAPGTGPALQPLLEELVSGTNGRLYVVPARMAWEIRVRGAPTKGLALRTLLDRRYGPDWADSVAVVLFGDDLTDESAFLALPGALTCRVGPVPLNGAQTCLPDPAALRRLLMSGC
ncbi:Trehalose-6-phosphate phosphatase [Candidatus Hydrogenisulfobacillus filiaventi]|uniref:Trehalose-phosphate phosphatase n=1 Tax=Candidatus Hydrogenisulfobacillus filiaventi TaxID=2707344 RepID=A0A6F8ZHJ1_9FIRM|nr:Trehalose-6-phosphate phosphatase [Candidatus Hydrogenisulfobacillus filiaventi]